ncbi:deoxyribonuclease V [Aneurinibacillus migulanus]|uniref:Endonuclease V n=1 Tax=Aneurinibacillus migulanus TaxID=47500 RepID=A0A0D1VEF0_ANEMI|nr:deoxyribonuclease V [Aneurinibacillus migulanus]KIV57824.1 endonuclease V [Aneurinibacillus migulanus]KON97419.1 endonuclease V [Aneurinibacillus migulanus]MED0895977.1 deoxyribonuclease V [Aneurinibacillus migulanus]MED1616651.1 deoxyribonuclease V [Aneurinibacillus migulanus]MED4730810.1 deoxyribonuclease V [Aneurinibacillus migulanus]
MKPMVMHPWDLCETDAIKLQQQLASKVIKQDQFDNIIHVAGVDVAYSKHSNTLVAAVVVMDACSLQVIETVVAEDIVQFPYIPGLFSFRELPPIVKAFENIKTTPDLVVCDGQGIAHPRRFGLASHLGVLFDIPTIGCGKTKLLGKAEEPGVKRGDCAPLLDNTEMIGNVVRTQDHIKPIYVSIGHRISLLTACEWIVKLAPQYRLPETTRYADQLVRKALATYIKSEESGEWKADY